MRYTSMVAIRKIILSATIAFIVGCSTFFQSASARPEPILRSQAVYAQRFFYEVPSGQPVPNSVHLAAEFNGWSRDAMPMRAIGAGRYERVVELPAGVYQYKFVLNGDQWINDPSADRSLEVSDNSGGMNSGVIVGPDPAQMPPAEANAIRAGMIQFDPTNSADVNVVAGNLLKLRIQTLADDVEAVTVRFSDGNSNWVAQPLARVSSARGVDSYAGLIETSGSTVHYLFELVDGSATRYVAGGMAYQTDAEAARKAWRVELKPAFETPEWARHAVWYQVFPERFRNGEPANDPDNTPSQQLLRWQSNWWETQPGEVAGAHNFYQGAGNVWKRRYGGDLQGMIEALPYLRELGINAIYFNPIFEAESMHKYDTADFRHIDDNFGFKGDIADLEGETDDPATWQWSRSDRLFLEFIEQAHAQGFKIIIDGVFNHVGREHPFFQDVVQKGRDSKYADWFEIESFADHHPADPAQFGKPGGFNFRAWDGPSGHLPAFKKDAKLGLAPGPREHIFAITTRWLAPDGDPSKGIDGWRMDVPGDIPHPFWIEWRKLVKETKPDAYISGEIWSMAEPWLQGDQFDAVMNYQFAMAAQSFFVNEKNRSTPTEFAARLVEVALAYPFQVSLVQQNLFDSHDTDRLASMFVNPDLAYDQANRLQDNGPRYVPDKPDAEQWQRLRQAVVAQMTYVGAPMIYYGTEAGMWSPDDPSNRMPMVWKDHEPYDDPEVTFDEAMFEWFQRMIAIRQGLMPLQLGFFTPLVTDDEHNTLAYMRTLGSDAVYVAINRSDRPQKMQIPLLANDGGVPLVNWLDFGAATLVAPADNAGRHGLTSTGMTITPEAGKLEIELPAYSSMVISRPELMRAAHE